jgi:hypothetical protein
MSEDDQKVEYANALEEARKLDDLLASLSKQLNRMGSNLVELGKGLQGLLWHQVSLPQPLDLVARNFSRELYERNYADVPDLLEQYKEAYAKRTELGERLLVYTQVKADQPQA